jgi:hypothetical protein
MKKALIANDKIAKSSGMFMSSSSLSPVSKFCQFCLILFFIFCLYNDFIVSNPLTHGSQPSITGAT